MFIVGFYKTALHFLAFCLVVSWINNKFKLKWIMLIFGLLLPIVVHYRFPSLAHQRWFGDNLGSMIIIPLFGFLSVLILLIILIKKKKNSYYS